VLIAKQMFLQWNLTVMISASLAQHRVYKDIQLLRPPLNLLHCLSICVSQEKCTVEAIKPAWGSHLQIVHCSSSSLIVLLMAYSQYYFFFADLFSG